MILFIPNVENKQFWRQICRLKQKIDWYLLRAEGEWGVTASKCRDSL